MLLNPGSIRSRYHSIHHPFPSCGNGRRSSPLSRSVQPRKSKFHPLSLLSSRSNCSKRFTVPSLAEGGGAESVLAGGPSSGFPQLFSIKIPFGNRHVSFLFCHSVQFCSLSCGFIFKWRFGMKGSLLPLLF